MESNGDFPCICTCDGCNPQKPGAHCGGIYCFRNNSA